jgi:hypothetical protein
METTKLVAIQQPSQMEGLLESFVWGVHILPDGERGRPVLHVDAYGEHGELRDSAFWLAVGDGEWRRCAA